ncbi:MAG TPA: lamin tail domain-containing protein [Candidatus Nanoarchaeia archaeon]|nr:lamin tail domain-containing protein [Candidatus Nanoarchaeia archaeon]
MKKILAIFLICAVVVLTTTSALAATGSNNSWLKNPFMRLWNAVHNLQGQLSNITVIPGPAGEQGPPGPAGECSCTGEVSASDFQALVERVERLEGNNLPDCIIDSDCNDNNACTDEACDFVLGCVYSNNQDPCNDGNPNTLSDACSSGVCNGGTSGGSGDSSGELIISEIMYNPNAVADTAGEWLELYNPGSSAVNLNGWSIQDYGTDSFTISEDFLVQPGSYAVLCKNTDISLNGGVSCDIQYSSFTLGNTADAIILLRPDSVMSDDVLYDTAVEPWKSLNNAGYSLQLDPAHYNSADNDDGNNWCNTDEPINGADYGTPGTMNSDCQ